MNSYEDKITLVAITEPAQRVNSEGFINEPTETKRVVYFNKKSVTMNEFYKSQQAGYTQLLKGDVKRVDYNGETLAEIGTKRYKIERTYDLNEDELELTLTDLNQNAEDESDNADDSGNNDGGGDDNGESEG